MNTAKPVSQAPGTYADLPGYLSMMTGDEKHSTSATSTLDVLWVLYDRVLDISPQNYRTPERDRFLLSKGHGPMAYYAVLAAKGLIPVEELPTFGRYDSRLGYHPDRNLIDAVEIASGSLGHGLPIALGKAIALRARAQFAPRVVVLVGDAELDEGSNHEAIALAGRMRLAQLNCVVIDNQSSAHGWPGGIAQRFAGEGWRTESIDGRDHEAIARAFAPATLHAPPAPLAVIAKVEPKA